MVEAAFTNQVAAWSKRRDEHGDAAVGRRGEDYVEQGGCVQAELRAVLNHVGGGQLPFFEYGLDFGCGWGRIAEALGNVCGHLWLMDILPEWTQRAAGMCRASTPVTLAPNLRPPIPDDSVQFVFDGMTLQSISDAGLFFASTAMLRRVAAPGGLVVSVHIANPKGASPARDVQLLTECLDLEYAETREIFIDKVASPYWMLWGRKR